MERLRGSEHRRDNHIDAKETASCSFRRRSKNYGNAAELSNEAESAEGHSPKSQGPSLKSVNLRLGTWDLGLVTWDLGLGFTMRTIIHISDIHFGHADHVVVERLVEKIVELQPDLIV